VAENGAIASNPSRVGVLLGVDKPRCGTNGSTREKSVHMKTARKTAVAAATIAVLAITAATALAAAGPTATTGAATQITYQSAVLAGSSDPKGASTEVYFEYGPTTSYGSTSAPIQIGAGTTTVPVSETVSGLAAYTKYDYRLVAVNVNGTTNGLNRTFKTAKIPLTLAIDASPNPVVYGGLVTVAGTLAGTGNANQPVALQQNPYPYTAGFTQVGNTELTSSTGAYTFTIPSLDVSTQYRVINANKPTIVSPTVDETDTLAVNLHTKGIGTRAHPATRFYGTVAPGSETDSKFAVQELFGKTWKLVGGGITANTTHNGVATFSVVVHFHHGGFFRVFVGTVEGANAESFSAPVAVRGYS
jgi:hypothetical protein